MDVYLQPSQMLFFPVIRLPEVIPCRSHLQLFPSRRTTTCPVQNLPTKWDSISIPFPTKYNFNQVFFFTSSGHGIQGAYFLLMKLLEAFGKFALKYLGKVCIYKTKPTNNNFFVADCQQLSNRAGMPLKECRCALSSALPSLGTCTTTPYKLVLVYWLSEHSKRPICFP